MFTIQKYGRYSGQIFIKIIGRYLNCLLSEAFTDRGSAVVIKALE